MGQHVTKYQDKIRYDAVYLFLFYYLFLRFYLLPQCQTGLTLVICNTAVTIHH